MKFSVWFHHGQVAAW